jgi:hypothetical protein
MSDKISDLVDAGAVINARIKRDELALAEIKTKLIDKGQGEYFGANKANRALVIFPIAKIAPDQKQLPEVRSAIGKDAFQVLFDRFVLWKPVKSCRDVAVRVLSPSKLKAFLEIAEVDCPAQVRFS